MDAIVENQIIQVPNHTILFTQSGSTAYNLRTETSDTDYRGCYLDESWEVLLGIKNNNLVFEMKEPDLSLFNLIKFIKLALNGNTNILEVLFAPEECVLYSNPFGNILRNNRNLFLTENTLHCLAGYYTCELRRALGETTGRLGEKRKEELEARGYSSKNAFHCIRLLDRGIDLISEGVYKVRYGHNEAMRSYIMGIKNKEVSIENFMSLYNDMHRKFNSLRDSNKLSKGKEIEANKKKIWTLVKEYLKDTIYLKLRKEKLFQ